MDFFVWVCADTDARAYRTLAKPYVELYILQYTTMSMLDGSWERSSAYVREVELVNGLQAEEKWKKRVELS